MNCPHCGKPGRPKTVSLSLMADGTTDWSECLWCPFCGHHWQSVSKRRDISTSPEEKEQGDQ